MTAAVFKEACHSFAQAAAPYLPIRDDAHYEEALALVESLLEEEVHGVPGAVRRTQPQQEPYQGAVAAL